MKDRYLFRGIDLETGEWRTGFYNWHEDDSFINVFESKLTEPENNYRENVLMAYSVEPKTIGQCTGLKDKNGVLIFEGDIIDFQDEGTVSVLYAVESSEYLLNFGDSFTEELKMFHADKLEITGNIHEVKK